MLTITRITGICSGVILSEIMAVLVFPRSATGEALTHMRTAMKKLTVLNALAWQHGPLLGGGGELNESYEQDSVASRPVSECEPCSLS